MLNIITALLIQLPVNLYIGINEWLSVCMSLNELNLFSF